LNKKAFKLWQKAQKQEEKAQEKNPTEKKHVYVIDFVGDIRASAVENLREEITAILSIATPKDEVIVRLESPGGMVNTYGLAASQLQRIRDKHIPLTVIVDKVAASGGYLMACVAHKILAAPFAIIGSIGVVAQLPNFHRLLKKKEIDYELITAGEYKRTLTMFGENTDKAREKFQEQIQDIHDHFKQFIHKNRGIVNLPEVATGEYWLASKALELKLVDELTTSDDYLLTQSHTADIYHVQYCVKKSVGSRLANFMQNQDTGINFLFK
jgi:serine protease SohB